VPTSYAARRPHRTIWGFHPARAHARLDVGPILVIGSDPETCRALAHRLAEAGYGVEWTVDASIVPAWVKVRPYALLLVDDCPSDVTDADPTLPVLSIPQEIADDGLLSRVRARIRR
jgi:hypothetical protein